MPLRDLIYSQYLKFISPVCRTENTELTERKSCLLSRGRKVLQGTLVNDIRIAGSVSRSSETADAVKKWFRRWSIRGSARLRDNSHVRPWRNLYESTNHNSADKC